MSSKKPKVAKLQLKPTTVNTGFASGTFDPRTGVAGYTLSPELAQMRDVFYGGASDYLANQMPQQQLFGQQVSDFGQGRFEQATQYDIPRIAQDWYTQNQALMAPERAAEEARLADTLFKTGRTGAAVGMEGGYVNPQQFALLKAREEANARLGLASEDRARGIQREDIGLGLNLYGTGQDIQTSPYQTAAGIFGLGTNIEGLGANTLNTVGNFAQQQMNIQQALQQNQQAINNAKASGGLGGLFGGIGQAVSGLNNVMGKGWGSDLLSAGANWYTGGLAGTTGMAGGVGKAAWMYSDEKLKKNIKKIGQYKNGLNKYSFTYIWGQDGEGVIAQEAMKVVPEAVTMDNGFYKVNYNLIGE